MAVGQWTLFATVLYSLGFVPSLPFSSVKFAGSGLQTGVGLAVFPFDFESYLANWFPVQVSLILIVSDFLGTVSLASARGSAVKEHYSGSRRPAGTGLKGWL
ncbi:MAG: hypothetical protein OXF67_00955 [Cyanobacteria bacterium MAG CAR4_bin_6]|nr:hypothetical protein [Cyanobacteria bacterium MAG CAR4_bin_6]